jgi:hypothetical protein
MESRSPEDLDGAFVRGEFAPRQHEAGLIQGISIARVKFPTRTKNLHKVPAEWAQERPLGGHLSVLSAGLGLLQLLVAHTAAFVHVLVLLAAGLALCYGGGDLLGLT